MKVKAILDVNVVAHEADDEVSVLLELEAPELVNEVVRPHASLQVVLDRSGSMAGPPLEGAKSALVELVGRLEPTDNFGLVAFDDCARVVVPAGPLRDKEQVIELIEGLTSGGTTDLAAGYLRGLREIRRVAQHGGTLLVISDGHVNAGLRDVDALAGVASQAYADSLVTSTLGYGRAYDETLLAALARSGSGNHVFATDPDAAGAAIAGEVTGLLAKVVQSLSLTVHFEQDVRLLQLFNDLPAQQIGDGAVMIELGDLYSKESRKVLMKLQVPGIAALGLATIAQLELVHVELPGLIEHTTTVPINVNVIPGDEAASRIPHPTVRSELLFQQAQESKRRASEAFEWGEADAGKRLLGESMRQLGESLEVAPESLHPDIADEMRAIGALESLTFEVGSSVMSKSTRDSYHRMNRKRGR